MAGMQLVGRGQGHTVTVRGRRLWIDDRPLPLLSGEIHFWRLDPAYWRDALRQARQLGLEIIATYVCWEFHQLASGEFDFTGASDPRRDLVRFIEMAADEGLWLIIRPGPYIYSEWTNGGIPDEVVRYHRLHPAFRRAAGTYMAAVVDVLRPYFATRGGPIILLQAENEPDPWPQFYEEALGIGTAPGLFQEFLEARYQTIEQLNQAWESAYIDFIQPGAVVSPIIHTRGYQNRYLDFCRFRHWFTAECVRWTAQTYRDLGVDVPIFTNVYTNNGIQNWPALEAHCDFVGPDAYPSHAFRGQPAEHRRFLHMLRFTSAYSRLPYISEFQAGIWHGGEHYTGVLTPTHYRMTAVSALLAGVVGWNWYMLVERDNWLWSPVNALGHPRPDLTGVFEEIVRLFHAFNPAEQRRLTDVGVVVDVLAETATRSTGSQPVLQALYDADIDYACVDAEHGPIDQSVIFFAGGDWLSAPAQERLLAFVEGGGCLICFQDAPILDGALNPLNLLGFALPDGILAVDAPQQVRVQLGDEICDIWDTFVFRYDPAPGDPIIAERIADRPSPGDELSNHCRLPVGFRYAVGYRKTLGRGSIIHLGVAPNADLLGALLRWLAVPTYSRAASPHVKTALFQGDQGYYVVVVNTGEEAGTFAIVLDHLEGSAWHGRDLTSGQPVHVTGEPPAVYVPVMAKSGCIIHIFDGTSPAAASEA